MNNIIDNMEYFEINGIKGALIRRDDIESITVSILLKTGNSFDEPLKSGVSSLTSILLNKGTKGLSAMDIADEFDSMGTSFLSTSGKDATFINLWTLKENFKKSMNLLKKIILEPVFPVEELEREKEKALSSLYQKLDSPADLSSYVFEKNIYENHPYGNLPTPESISNIQRDDIISFYNNFYNRENLFIVFAGNINIKDVKEGLTDFDNLNNIKIDNPHIPEVRELKKDRVILFNKPDAMQSQIRYGFTSIKRDINNYESLKVANYILGGGGFSSRLLLKVRSESGLTYSISSSINANLYGGNFVISSFSKHDTTIQALKLSEKVLKDFIKEGITDKELADAISYYTGNIPLSLETPADIAHKVLYSELYSLGKDYIKKEIENIKRVKKGDIKNISNRYLNREKKLITIVGNYDKLKDYLKDFEDLEIIDKIF